MTGIHASESPSASGCMRNRTFLFVASNAWENTSRWPSNTSSRKRTKYLRLLVITSLASTASSKQDIERVQVGHPDVPAVFRHLHAAAVIEIVKDAFGAREHREAGLGEFGFGPAALRVPGCGLVHSSLQWRSK